jgi:hypothetical protein
MKVYHSLSHMRRDCKYHVVFIPKRRKKWIFGVLRRQLWQIFHELARHKESKIVEGHLIGSRAYVSEYSAEEEDERYEQMKFGIYTRRLGLIWRL